MNEMDLFRRDGYRVILDINQPGKNTDRGTYRPGPITSKVVEGPLPEGTLLYGHFWMEGLTKYGREAILGRYTEALLPDGRRVPVCIIPGDLSGLMVVGEGSKPGEAILPKEMSALAVEQWP
jgi:serine/threonine-protein kinase